MSKHPLDTKPLLSTRELAKYWGLRIQTLQKWRVTGEGPIYFKIGKLVKYPRYAVLEYEKTRMFRGTSERITDGGNHEQ